MKNLISIVSGCFNEAENIEVLYKRIKNTILPLRDNYDFEIIFIDNASEDGTQEILRGLASKDNEVKVILNARNFGHIRSPYWGIIQSSGLATIYLASDLQDPPETITEFIKEWEMGWLIVLATKKSSETSYIFHRIRKLYYKLLNKIADIRIINDATGFGLYDRKVVDQLRVIKDPYPFLRGIIGELGFPVKTVDFLQPKRIRGFSKNNLYTLYDIGILGIISHSLVPIRLASLLGFFLSALSFLTAIAFLIYKILFWNEFPVGIAPIVIGMFFMFGVLLSFIGLLGEYIGAIHTYVQKRPIVVEKERLNF